MNTLQVILLAGFPFFALFAVLIVLYVFKDKFSKELNIKKNKK